MAGEIERAAYYRRRAEEVRTIAEGMSDTLTRATLVGVAADYEKLARQMERIAETERTRRNQLSL